MRGVVRGAGFVDLDGDGVLAEGQGESAALWIGLVWMGFDGFGDGRTAYAEAGAYDGDLREGV